MLLFPCAVTLAVLAEPILRLLSASASRRRPERCRYWGRPVVVLGNVLLIGTLIGARLEPRVIMRCFVVAFAVVTLGANLALIAWLGAEGAALAMLLTEVGVRGHDAARSRWRGRDAELHDTAGSALVAGAAMAVVMAALQVLLPVALVVGGIVYVGAFVLGGAAGGRRRSPGSRRDAAAAAFRDAYGDDRSGPAGHVLPTCCGTLPSMRNGTTLIEHLDAVGEMGRRVAQRRAIARRMSRRRKAQLRALAERVRATRHRPEA